MTQTTQLPVIRDDAGNTYLPAATVSALLRGLGDTWTTWVEQGLTDLDGPTVDALAEQLDDVANQIDVDCIAALAPRPDNDDQEAS